VLTVKARTPSHRVRGFSPFLLFCAAILFGSCSVGGYLTAYFNTYYNASRVFSEAEEEILGQRDLSRQDTTFLRDFSISGTAKTKLTSVVEKCSKILQDHAETGLVDDALMMIGKSYYYQNELQKAERKFGELIESYPDEDLALEAKLLLASSYYRMKDLDRARTVALNLADSTGGEDESISSKAFVLLGHIQSDEGDYAGARNSYRYAEELAGSDAEQSEASMQVASMSIRLQEIEAALEAYRDAEDESPDYRSTFRARMGQIRMLNKLGRYDESLEELDDLRSNTNFREFFGEIDLELANTMKSKGDYEDAVALYYAIDTTYARTESSAQSHYELGYIYETHFLNYDSAFAVYQRGRSQAPQAKVTETIARRHDLLKSYREFSSAIAELESLKTVILHPEVATVSDTGLGDGGAAGDTPGMSVPQVALPSLDSVRSALARNKADLAGLFYSEMGISDSATFWYENLLAYHPETPYTPKAKYALAQLYSRDSTMSPGISDSLYRDIIATYPETEFAGEARRILGMPPRETTGSPADSIYAVGEQYLQAGDAPEAILQFDSLLTSFPASPVAQKAEYAIAWIYEELLRQPDSAIAHYRNVVDKYPSSVYTSNASKKLSTVPANLLSINDSSQVDSIDTNRIEEHGDEEANDLEDEQMIPPIIEPEGQKPDSTFDDDRKSRSY
jgi:tetratricopeptide (TPR) repeat protein